MMDENLKIGEMVIFSRVHHAHNRHLKKRVGERGMVVSVPEKRNDVLVQFHGGYEPRFWINKMYLEFPKDNLDGL